MYVIENLDFFDIIDKPINPTIFIDKKRKKHHFNKTVETCNLQLSFFDKPNKKLTGKISVKELNKFKSYTQNEELVKLYQKNKDEKIKAKLLELNKKIITTIANKYTTINTPVEELIQEGTIGFLKGLEKFDISKGVKFTTFQYYQIASEIQLYYLKNRNGIASLSLTGERRRNELKNKTFQAKSKGKKQSEKNLEKLSLPFLRLDQKIGEEENTEAYELLADDNSQQDFLTKEFSYDWENISNKVLKEKERFVITQIFFNDKTFFELADELEMTHQGVRRIKEVALKKLKKYFEKHYIA